MLEEYCGAETRVKVIPTSTFLSMQVVSYTLSAERVDVCRLQASTS